MITETRISFRDSLGASFGYDTSSSPESEKVVLRKRPRVGDEDLGKASKRLTLHKVFSKGIKRHYDYKPNPLFSAEQMNLTGDYTEDMIRVIDEGAESDILDSSDVYSYDQEGTPISKTKRLHGLNKWLGKIHHYGKQTRLSKIRHKRSTSQFIHQKILNTPIEEEIPDDAYTCYHQYKTENFDKYFDTLMLRNQDTKEFSDRDQIPVYSPLNELTYENLQSLRKQLFTLPPMTGDSNSESDTEETLRSNSGNVKQGEKFTTNDISNNEYGVVAQPPSDLSDSATAETISEVGTPSDDDNIENTSGSTNEIAQFHPMLRLPIEDQNSSTSSTSAQQDSAECPQSLVPANSGENNREQGNLIIEHRPIGSEDDPPRDDIFSPVPTPEVFKALFENNQDQGNKYLYGVGSPHFKEAETISLDEALIDQLERKYFPFIFCDIWRLTCSF
ncbi:hypothetical protein BN7_5905 [Wickerhamomyces ciferrii]|uniref:Uncharacterized protein n=1 Tax=Wickerhamomyces ciferrii (strain ATCC 14091 / BCRC 22168 / CBS 111 / JCM 3599 / NBRC 0793 / NRRL Y-1031 F-60-10) TaxID=1206466 RepID=K0KZ03_WICCF|nr:uncharacterized protein BN7_5905 [Wickerhamomyces ciferrii]CCH46313.1 hypothetical protein BN7_5905 [Wickerhamomyces ciferrii]